MKGERIGREQLAALGMTLVVAALTVGFLAVGCGKEQSKSVATETGETQSSTSRNAVVPASTATPASAITEATPQGEEATAPAPETLPPDILASASEDLVLPGDVVSIEAQGTTDVTEVTLTDGRGKTQPLVYDSPAGVWRVHYRVPLRTTTNSVGLSVTAKNGLNQWRRVWVFINVQREGASADSLSN